MGCLFHAAALLAVIILFLAGAGASAEPALQHKLIVALEWAVGIWFYGSVLWWTSNMIIRKHRSRFWMLAPFVLTPLVLVLWCLPPKKAPVT